MKKLSLFIAFIGLASVTWGQSATYKSFQVNLTWGFDVPLYGKGTSSDFVEAIEPQYHLSDKFTLGFRIEQADLIFNIDPENTFLFGTVYKLHGHVASYCATGEYYFSKRAFIGGGLGFFKPSLINTNTDPNANAVTVYNNSSKFGFFPEIGFEAGHFRMSIDYNVAGNNSNYVAANIGFFIGGGKKK
jgi:hypothetical protein